MIEENESESSSDDDAQNLQVEAPCVYLDETPSRGPLPGCLEKPKAWQVASRFLQRLRDIETEMVERNKNLRVPYTVLYPSRIITGTGK